MPELSQAALAGTRAFDDRHRECRVSDKSREKNPACHIVVNADHIRTQTLVGSNIGFRARSLRILIVDLCHLIHSLDNRLKPVGCAQSDAMYIKARRRDPA